MVQRNKRRLSIAERRIAWRVIAVAALLVGLWIIFAPGRGVLHFHRLQTEMDSLVRENRELAERNAELEEEIQRLRNDDAYLESLARKKYGLLQENETVYEFTPRDK